MSSAISISLIKGILEVYCNLSCQIDKIDFI